MAGTGVDDFRLGPGWAQTDHFPPDFTLVRAQT